MTDANIREAKERSEARYCSDRVEVYVRGSGWPSDATVSAAESNPWTKRYWNLTAQVKILKRDPAEADRLAHAAGHKGALTARFKSAK
jgi:hypothetical protein